MNTPLYFFLGANSGSGFHSLYDAFSAEPSIRRLFIIKGGPGCGKSSFMRSIAKALSEHGLLVHYFSCSGDPDSLDAIFFPALGTAYLDGTAPHVVEPSFPGIVDNYINLGIFYDSDSLNLLHSDIINAFLSYKAAFSYAYSALSATAAFQRNLFEPLYSNQLLLAISRRADGIISRELPKSARPPASSSLRFLDALSCHGYLHHFQSAAALCDKLYLLDNDFDLSRFLLAPICDAAISRGFNVIKCPSPLFPDRIAHLLIPDLSLGFLSVSKSLKPNFNFHRHLRLNSLIDRDSFRDSKRHFRSAVALRDALLQKAFDSLASAKLLHDNLEAFYNPHVDFGGVYALADAHINSLLSLASSI